MDPSEYDDRYHSPREEPESSPTEKVEKLLSEAKRHACISDNLYFRAKIEAKNSDYCEEYVSKFYKASTKLINKIHKIEAP